MLCEWIQDHVTDCFGFVSPPGCDQPLGIQKRHLDLRPSYVARFREFSVVVMLILCRVFETADVRKLPVGHLLEVDRKSVSCKVFESRIFGDEKIECRSLAGSIGDINTMRVDFEIVFPKVVDLIRSYERCGVFVVASICNVLDYRWRYGWLSYQSGKSG